MEMNRFSQQNTEWENDLMGGDGTIGDYGCLVTCMAMACTKFGFDETPRTLNRKLKQVSGYVGNYVVVQQITWAVPGMRQVAFWQCPDDPAPIWDIDYHIGSGHVVIVEIDYSKTEPGVQNHWVILEEKIGEDYKVVDPWPLEDKQPTLMEIAAGGDPAQAIRNVYVLAGDNSRVNVAPPRTSGKLRVVAELGANLRSSPMRSDNLVATLACGFEIDTVEGMKPVINEGIEWVAVQLWVARRDEEGTILVE